MSILFIADVHLSNKKPKIVNGFLHFLNNHAAKSSALYILGDLFEVWLGDDDKNTLHIDVAHGLQILKKKRIPCYFMHGNHDFLLGPKYANLCGMILLPYPQVIQLSSGENIVILHGDSLCIKDTQYLKMRNFLNYSILQKIFLSLPFSLRSYIFFKIYTYCNKYKQHKSLDQISVDNKTVINLLLQSQSNTIIHGHTHQSAIHNIFYSNKHTFKRIVLGKWDDQNGSMVKINEKNNTISLINFSLNTKE